MASGRWILWLPDDLKVRRIIHSHHLVIVGGHDPGTAASGVEDLYGIGDAIVIRCHSHAAHQNHSQDQSMLETGKKRKDYTFRRQFLENPGKIPDCPKTTLDYL